MFRKVLVLVILVLGLQLMGCAKSEGNSQKDAKNSAPPVAVVPAGPGPTSTDPKATADIVLKLTEAKDWDKLYDYIYREIQKTVSREQFIKLRKDEAAHSKIKYKNFVVGQPQMVAEWQDKIDGITYKNVSEVPYTVDVITPKGELKINNNMYLIQTPEKNWRYLWIKK